MFDSTDRNSRIGFGFHGALQPLRREFDLSEYVAVQEIPVFQSPVPSPHERALQALRDVRHLLPPHGIAIVDSVLDGIG